MNVIDRLKNFEDMKRCGFIEYNEDGSGTYYNYYNNNQLYLKIKFTSSGETYDFQCFYITGELLKIKFTSSGETYEDTSDEDNYDTIIYTLSRLYNNDNTTKYIDGWIKEKLEKELKT